MGKITRQMVEEFTTGTVTQLHIKVIDIPMSYFMIQIRLPCITF